MIAKGKARTNAGQLADYLLRNPNAEVLMVRGTTAHDLKGALLEMEDRLALTRSQFSVYHASLRWPADETLYDGDQLQAIRILEERLGFTGQALSVVRHNEEDGPHLHLVWSLVDVKNERAVRYSHNYRKHEEAAREIESRFELRRVQGAHVDRDGQSRPQRTPDHWEYEQAKHRQGHDPRAWRQSVRDAWEHSDNGASLKAAIEENRGLMANGDRRDCFVIVSEHGAILALNTKTVGARAKDIRAKLADLDRSQLPSVDEARQLQRERRQEQQKGEQRSDGRGAYDQLREESARAAEAFYFDRDKAAQQWEAGMHDAAIAFEQDREKEAGWQKLITPVTRQEPAPEQQQTIGPELGKTAGLIRLAVKLTPNAQEFANALEDRGLHLARVTAADREQFKIEDFTAKKTADQKGHGATHGDELEPPAPEPWLKLKGGYGDLNDEQKEGAEHSWRAWQKARKEQGEIASFGLEEYVDYVQKLHRDEDGGQNLRLDELVVVNEWGSITRLSKRNTGKSRKELDEYLKGIDRDALLSVGQAKEVAQEVRDHWREEKRRERRAAYVEERSAQIAHHETVHDIGQAYAETQSGPEFAAALEQRGLHYGRATDEDVARAELQRSYDLRAQQFEPGEYVAMNERGQIYKLDATTIHDDEDQIMARLHEIDGAKSVSELRALHTARSIADDSEHVFTTALHTVDSGLRKVARFADKTFDLSAEAFDMAGSAARAAVQFIEGIMEGPSNAISGGSEQQKREANAIASAREQAKAKRTPPAQPDQQPQDQGRVAEPPPAQQVMKDRLERALQQVRATRKPEPANDDGPEHERKRRRRNRDRDR